jgi:mannan endo-1,4-beta-mannosidase
VVAARVAGLLALQLAACGTQYADPIQETPGRNEDGCGAWLTESECLADTAHGCSFQPNDVGCKTSDPACTPGVCRSGDPFVRRRQGQELWLHDSPYRFVGTVSWGIGWGRICDVNTMPDQSAALVRVFDDLVELEINVLKVWAFQSYAGSSGSDYSSLERVVDAARRAGVRLIFVLENHYEAGCSTGPTRDDAWYGGGYALPYGDHALSLPDYARGLVTHFRDEPTILAWEILHEGGAGSFDALNGFSTTMASLLRENDPNHLIVLGLDNGNTAATDRSGTPSNYARLNGHPAIDALDAHDFFAHDTPLIESMAELAALASTLEKPIFAGATAVELENDDTSAAGYQRRATQIEAKLHAAFDAGYAGFLIYDYIPDWTDTSWSFDTRTEDPLAGPNGVVVRNAIPNP